MNRRSLIVLAVLSLLAAAAGGAYLGHVLGSSPAAPAHAAPEPQRVQTVNGETTVVVAPDAQRASGIDVAPLVLSPIQEQGAVFATVIDLQPLFDLGTRLASASADRDSARAQSAASRAQFERSELLYKDNHNVSLKSVQDARTAEQSDQAKLHAAESAVINLEANLRQQFGDVLKNAAAAPASSLLQQLSHGRAVVLRITLPFGGNIFPTAHIVIDGPNGQRLAASKLSPAPQTDTAIQGVSYFYLLEHPLPIGTRTAGHLAAAEKNATGLLIPDNALIWYGGQRWAYVRTAADRFTRRLVSSDLASTEGIITTGGFRAGDMVVIRGAQLLLSEEQRPQGIATACKDPPECDD